MKIQLEMQTASGWVELGEEGVATGRRSGSGSSNRADTHYVCEDTFERVWRGRVDVDLEGHFDSGGYAYSPQNSYLSCSANGI